MRWLLLVLTLTLLVLAGSSQADPYRHVHRVENGSIWDLRYAVFPSLGTTEGRAPPPPTPSPVAPPAKGLNLGHVACPLTAHGIVARYHLLGVRGQVRAILAQKREQGYTWIRHMVWWTSDPIGDVPSSWGVVPSGLPEPYAGNLRAFLTDARDAGFKVEVAMGPSGPNNPTLQSFVPALTETNWQTIQVIHGIAESVNPSTTYDLENEGAPHPYWGEAFQVQSGTYLTTIWNRAQSWGTHDFTVSFHSGRWRFLLPLFSLPWYEVHVYGSDAPYDVPSDGKDIVVGERFKDVPSPLGPVAEAYWPLLSTPDDDGDANCSRAATP